MAVDATGANPAPKLGLRSSRCPSVGFGALEEGAGRRLGHAARPWRRTPWPNSRLRFVRVGRAGRAIPSTTQSARPSAQHVARCGHRVVQDLLVASCTRPRSRRRLADPEMGHLDGPAVAREQQFVPAGCGYRPLPHRTTRGSQGYPRRALEGPIATREPRAGGRDAGHHERTGVWPR